MERGVGESERGVPMVIGERREWGKRFLDTERFQ
jgi:hypothetical protein